MNQTLENPILYILMRVDLPSMNAGKAMAQASHASNSFVFRAKQSESTQLSDLFSRWENATSQGFGTVIVLAANKSQILTTVQLGQNLGYLCDTVVDPTYPYILNREQAGLVPVEVDSLPRVDRGDQVVLFRNEITCGYIFGLKSDSFLSIMLKNFPLHP